MEVAGEAGTVRSRTLDSNRLETAEALHPYQHRRVAGLGSWELAIAKPTANQVHNSSVVKSAMGIYSADYSD
jgi:hypothetical protein